jgi:tRNA nucleotidyltransferase (CCA-adding enzyme)
MAADVLAVLRAVPGGRTVLDSISRRSGVWVVGGAVRDALLGREPKDIDLVVAGDAHALALELGEVLETHDRFGTTTVDVEGGTVNVAMARRETYSEPGALPEVEAAGLEEDLARRDFTVNAVAVDPAGELHTAPGVLEDLQARRLRVLHDGSFRDDPTRLWRLARYASRLGFAAEEQTGRLARAAVAGGALATVAGQRLGAELRLALTEPDPQAALTAAHELGLLPANMEPSADLYAAARALLPAGDAGLLALAAATVEVDAAALRQWLDDLGIPARERDTVVAAGPGARELAAALAGASRASEIVDAVGRRPVEAVALAGAVGAEGPARAWLDDLRHVRLEISGDDLLAAGVPAGPELGRRLQRALAARLDGEARGREEQLAVALAP